VQMPLHVRGSAGYLVTEKNLGTRVPKPESGDFTRILGVPKIHSHPQKIRGEPLAWQKSSFDFADSDVPLLC
jgi:hypothetical protein